MHLIEIWKNRGRYCWKELASIKDATLRSNTAQRRVTSHELMALHVTTPRGAYGLDQGMLSRVFKNQNTLTQDERFTLTFLWFDKTTEDQLRFLAGQANG